MRYALAAILVCALATSAASARQIASSNSRVASKADAAAPVAKRNGPHASRPARSGSGGVGGIHPLVGSGDY